MIVNRRTISQSTIRARTCVTAAAALAEDDAGERRADRDECRAVAVADESVEHVRVVEQEDQRGHDDDAATDAEHSAEKARDHADGEANNGEKRGCPSRVGRARSGESMRYLPPRQMLDFTDNASERWAVCLVTSNALRRRDATQLRSTVSPRRSPLLICWRAPASFAAALIAIGVQPGDRVTVQLEKCVEGVWLYLAVLRAGAIYMPLNTGYTDAEMAYFIGDAEPALIVVEPSRVEAVSALVAASGARAKVATLRDIETRASSAVPVQAVERDDDDTAAILYTSGTTGRSKGAMISHQQPAFECADAGRNLGIHAGRHPRSCAADLSRARTVRGAALRVVGRRNHAIPAAFRAGSGIARARGRDRLHGCADLLHATARIAGLSAAADLAAVVD